MRSTGIVLSGAAALGIVAFAVWIVSREPCSSSTVCVRAHDLGSQIAAAKSDAASNESRERRDAGAARDACETSEQRGGSIRVLVFDEAGAPLEGARVGILKPAEPDRNGIVSAPLEFVDGSVLTTDSSGGATLDLQDATAFVDVAAAAARFVPGFWPRARAGDEVRLDLRPAAELTGFVRDRDGAPVAGATIRWSCDGPRRASGETNSAGDGSYRLVDVVELRTRLGWRPQMLPWIEADADGFAGLRFSLAESAKRRDDRHWQLDLWMLRGGRVTGRIVDQVSRRPVAGAEVFLRGTRGFSPPPPRRTKSDADGRFVLERVPSFGVQNAFPTGGHWGEGLLGEICVVADGHGVAWQELEAPEDEEELVRNFELPPVCDVRGRVVDERGDPVESATVEVEVPRSIGSPCEFDCDRRFDLDDSAAAIHTDRDGHYLLHDVPIVERDGERTSIWVEGMERLGVQFKGTGVGLALLAGAVVAAPDLVMRSSAATPRRSVHFVDEFWHDVPRVRFITLARSRGNGQIHCVDGEGEAADATGRAQIYTTNSNTLAEEQVWIRTEHEGFASALVELPDESTEATYTLHPEHRLRGVLRDVDGRPGLAEVLVVAQCDAQSDLLPAGGCEETSSTTGRFLVRGLPAGPWRVEVRCRKYRLDEPKLVLEDVAEREGELEIVLPDCSASRPKESQEGGAPSDPETGRVEVSLRFAESGRPVVHADLRLGEGSCPSTDAQPLAPGRFLFDRVEPGVLPLRIAVNHALTTIRTVTVAAGATALVAVEIESGLSVSGHVKVEELPASSWRKLVAIESVSGEERKCDVAPNGAFRMRGLDPDRRYRLALDFLDEKEEGRRWLFSEPPHRPVEFGSNLRPFFTAAGAFSLTKGLEGFLPAGTVVRTVDETGSEVDRFVVPSDDRSILRHLAPGDYIVQLSFPDGTPLERRIAVTAIDRITAVRLDQE